MKERTQLQKLVTDWEEVDRGLEDVQVLIELGEESEDTETLAEVRELLPGLEKSIGRMEFARMLSGEHDPNNAIVSINSPFNRTAGDSYDRRKTNRPESAIGIPGVSTSAKGCESVRQQLAGSGDHYPGPNQRGA